MPRLSGFVIPILVLASACDEPPPAATLSEVPARFVGRWDASIGDCGRSGPYAVTVTPTDVLMEDTRVQVTGAAPDGETAVRVDGHFTGPGAEWDGSVRLELGDGGRELSVVSGSAIVPRVKCP